MFPSVQSLGVKHGSAQIALMLKLMNRKGFLVISQLKDLSCLTALEYIIG
jgi:hypothetical protein